MSTCHSVGSSTRWRKSGGQSMRQPASRRAGAVRAKKWAQWASLSRPWMPSGRGPVGTIQAGLTGWKPACTKACQARASASVSRFTRTTRPSARGATSWVAPGSKRASP